MAEDDGICDWFGRFLLRSAPGLFGSDMIGPKLCIRNLTSEQLVIKQIHTSIHDNQNSELERLYLAGRDELIVLARYSTTRTEIRTNLQYTKAALNLKLQVGEDERIVDLSTNAHAEVLHQDQRLIVILNRPDSFLTICERPDLKSWMRAFKEDTSLAALSIPGTHNSPTCHISFPSVRCQAVPPKEQLEHGVRFFDLRVQPKKTQDSLDEKLNLVHSIWPVSIFGGRTLRNLLSDFEAFLVANPSETVIISVKREGLTKASDGDLANILRTHYANEKWFTEPRIPIIGEVRGKIVLMRRFGLSDAIQKTGQGFGLDAENWADNTTNCIHGHVCVQDFYAVMQTDLIAKKIDVCCEQFERAATAVCPVPEIGLTASPVDEGEAKEESAQQLLYLNFLSASNFFRYSCWPEKIAERLNPAVTKFLCEKHDCGDRGIDGPGQSFEGDGGLGVVVCDWVGKDGDWDLVNCILAMNSRRLFRERGFGWLRNEPTQVS